LQHDLPFGFARTERIGFTLTTYDFKNKKININLVAILFAAISRFLGATCMGPCDFR